MTVMAIDNAAAQFEDFDYINLDEVDPNFTAIPEDIYELKVLKLERVIGATGKPRVSGTFSVVNHDKYSARRLFHTFWDVMDNGSRDAKALKRLSDAVGIQAKGGFLNWLETMTVEQPVFRVKVTQIPSVDYKTKEPRLNAKGEQLQDNKIDFRNVEPVTVG